MSDYFRRVVRCLVPVAAAALLPACGTLDTASNQIVRMVSPYQVEVVQGNFVSREQVEWLKQGMTRAQVRDLLGSPLITSLFHGERWDYVFTLSRQGKAVQHRKLTVFFKGDHLDRHEGDDMPSEAEFVASLQTQRKLGKVPVLSLSEEALKELAVKADARAPAPVAEAPMPLSYPPLEAPAR